MSRNYTDWVNYLNTTVQVSNTPRYEAIDLFAGCGGLSLGFEAAGIKTIGYEMNEDCCATYRDNLHSICYREKITTKTVYPKVQIIIGGPPCQPFSRRGNQKGKDDERNGFPAFIEAVKQVKPEIFVCENVKGLPERDNLYFNKLLSEFEKLGYKVDYQVFQMTGYDVPQRRERLVIVGHHGGFKFPTEKDYIITAGEALGEMAFRAPEDAHYLTATMDEYILKYEQASHCAVPRDLHLDRPARTLTCRNLAGATSDMHRIKLDDGRRRRITVREAARLQTFPDWFSFSGNEESQFTQIGNAVPPLFAYGLATAVINYLEGNDMDELRNLPSINNPVFYKKDESIQKLIREALDIVKTLKVPLMDSERKKERTAMALLAIGDVKKSSEWKKIKSENNDYAPLTREIISFYNEKLGDNLSSGSYDDVRRSDIKPLLQAGIVVNSKPTANISNPTRGYKISNEFAKIIRNYGQQDWYKQAENFNKSHKSFQERISAVRNLPKLKVILTDGREIELNDGEHNAIQKQIIEQFLAIHGNNATVLYCGDSDNKYGVIFEKEKLIELGFKDLKQGKLPDVVAYSESKGWIYLIEAYHSSNPITPTRKADLEDMIDSPDGRCLFITAFDNDSAYKNCPEEIAWETEIWIATEPEHIIHKDGVKYLSPYKQGK